MGLFNSSSAAPSRNASTFSKAASEKGTPFTGTPDTRSEVAGDDRYDGQFGRVVGGKYKDSELASSAHEDLGPVSHVDIDMPLTITEHVHQNGQEYIVLVFAEGDKENPFNWSPGYKRMITGMLCLMTLFIGLATTAYSSGISSMVKELNATEIEGQLGIFTFNFTCALAPMILAPFCEMAGRKIIYSGGFLGFSLLFIGLALAKDIGTIIGLRLLLGLFGCIGTILVGGTFDDMYEPRYRSRPMALFSWVAIFGTVAAPIYAGYIDQSLGWRWIEAIQGFMNVPLLICIILYFPETRGGARLHKRAMKLRKATGDDRYVAAEDILTPSVKHMLKASSVKAIQMLATEPVVFAFGLWIAFCWGVTFMFLSVIPITFQEKRGWSEGTAGLPYIALALGTTLGWLAHHLQMRKYEKLSADETRVVTPESRLYGAMFGAVWLPVGKFTEYRFSLKLSC